MAPSPFSLLRSAFSPGSKFSALLRTYFRSGWAFFIPYLAAYLLYAWLDGPVNPGNAGNVLVERISGNGSAADSAFSLQPSAFLPPSLLHVYWFLHAFHAVLGGLALIAGRRRRLETGDRRPETEPSDSDRTCHAPATRHSSLDSARNPAPACREPVKLVEGPSSALQLFSLSALQKSAPWLLLALIFWIPGLYLEWPSDPWEHLRRINEWHAHDTVTAHSSWNKSSYFLPYSLTGRTNGLDQLSLLNIYYTSVCLLLSWQYYLLARAAGLSKRYSFIFVLLNALTFGNNIFSFYRYYGLSSSIIAQISAVALTRNALEWIRPKGGNRESRTGSPWPCEDCPVVCRLLFRGFVVSALITLTVFNHIQGLGIGGLGILAIIVWRLIEWKRTMLLWLIGAAAVLSLAIVLWFPRNSALDEIYRHQGWLNGWYGFNLFSRGSPASLRSLHILGTFGVISIALSLWLALSRNHPAGWLTLVPVLALALPCVALPFAHVIATERSLGNIVTFHRMLLAVPMGMALLAALGRPRPTTSPKRHWIGNRHLGLRSIIKTTIGTPWPLLPSLSILVVVALTSSTSGYNRIGHSILSTPNDLQLTHHIAAWEPARVTQTDNSNTIIIDTPLGHETRQALFLPDNTSWERLRLINVPGLIHSLDYRLRDLHAVVHHFDTRTRATESARPDHFNLFHHARSLDDNIVIYNSLIDRAWITLGGAAPKSIFTNSQLIISNPMGYDSVIFNQDPIPISRYKRYRLNSTVRQSGSKNATNFLAVAWYSYDMRLLSSRLIEPEGAGNPRGWNNSTYSFYGLVDQPAPKTWGEYSISFGLGETASIPANAAFLRIGALLNYRATPNATTEITNVTLTENPIQSHLILTAPGFWHLYTPVSHAALLSKHWLAQDVSTAHIGTQELRFAALNVSPSD